MQERPFPQDSFGEWQPRQSSFVFSVGQTSWEAGVTTKLHGLEKQSVCSNSLSDKSAQVEF